jgi:hypothetical protein
MFLKGTSSVIKDTKKVAKGTTFKKYQIKVFWKSRNKFITYLNYYVKSALMLFTLNIFIIEAR